MRAKLSTLLLAVVVAGAAPAAADWQFTKWGMTPGQVAKKSPVQVTEVVGDEQNNHMLTTERGMHKLLEGDWTSGVFRFHVSYQFDAARHLAAVDLEILDDGQAMDVANALVGRYGKPEREDNGSLVSRNWTTPTETIEFLGPLLPYKGNKGFHGKIIYVSRKNSANTGL